MNLRKIALILVSIFILTAQMTLVASANNNRYSWGYQKSKNEQPANAGPKFEQVLKETGSYYKDTSGEKIIYLTFDNGYENGYTLKILDILKEHQVPATFFVTGHYLETASDVVVRMANEGHIVGNHSWSHPDMTQITKEQIKEELEKVRVKYEELTGIDHMNYIRPPRGVFSRSMIEYTNSLGYTHVFWSLAFEDWKINNQKGKQYAYDKIMSQLHPGAIILLHSVSKDNALALEQVIIDAKERGYEFKSLDYLISKNHLTR